MTDLGKSVHFQTANASKMRLNGRTRRYKIKAPGTFQSGRPGSPPPELPNYDVILEAYEIAVNITLVMDLAAIHVMRK